MFTCIIKIIYIRNIVIALIKALSMNLISIILYVLYYINLFYVKFEIKNKIYG